MALEEAYETRSRIFGGLRIALYLTSLLSVPLLPHLMSPTLAQLHGVPAKASKKIELPLDHPWQPLATFLESDDAQILEQEKIDPAQIALS